MTEIRYYKSVLIGFSFVDMSLLKMIHFMDFSNESLKAFQKPPHETLMSEKAASLQH